MSQFPLDSLGQSTATNSNEAAVTVRAMDALAVLEWALITGFDPKAEKRKQRTSLRRMSEALNLPLDRVKAAVDSPEFKAARDDALEQLHPAESPVVRMLHQKMSEIAWKGIQRMRDDIENPETSVTERRQITFGLLDRMQIEGQGVVNKALEGITANSVLILQGLSPEAAAEWAAARKSVLQKAAEKVSPTVEVEGRIEAA